MGGLYHLLRLYPHDLGPEIDGQKGSLRHG